MTILRSTVALFAAGVFTAAATAQHAPARIASENPADAPAAQEAKQAKPATKKAKKNDGTLTIGDRAPKPALSRIFKGDEKFKNFKSGNVYVMEFWATWCGPCRAGMPHLTEVQEKYQDQGLTIIGVSREEPSKVEDFLAKDEWDKKTGYTIALDEGSKTNNAYMKAAGQNGIPTAFIVGKDGRVEWIGHPMSMDEPLDMIIKETWDRDAFRMGYENALARAKQERKRRQELMAAQRDGDFDKALELMDTAIAENPGSLNMKVQRFQMMVGPMNNPSGYDYGWKMLKENRDNASLLNAIAWFTLDDDSVKDRDLEFAMAAAKAANEATAGTDSAILDTLARAYFEAGDMDRAIKFQRKAVDKCENEQMLGDLEATLKSYEKSAKSNSA